MSDIPPLTDEARKIAACDRYMKAAHAVQSGIAVKMNYDATFTAPKHLRVGIDTTKVEHGALASLHLGGKKVTLR